jgi:archaellum component FlaC
MDGIIKPTHVIPSVVEGSWVYAIIFLNGGGILEDKTFEIMEKMYIEFSKRFDSIDTKFDSIDTKFDGMESRLDRLENEIKKTNMIIEHDIQPKIKILFEGYKLNSEKLDRIEKEVSKHEEIILRRVK